MQGATGKASTTITDGERYLVVSHGKGVRLAHKDAALALALEVPLARHAAVVAAVEGVELEANPAAGGKVYRASVADRPDLSIEGKDPGAHLEVVDHRTRHLLMQGGVGVGCVLVCQEGR